MFRTGLAVSEASAGYVLGGRGSDRGRRHLVAAYLLMAPAVVLVLGVLAYPLGWVLWASLTNWTVANPSAHFIGLRNYLVFLGDPLFWRMTANTVGYTAVTAVLKLAVGVAIALVLSRPSLGRPLVFLAAFLPWAYPASVALLGWYWFMIPPVHASYGPFMAGLRLFFDNRLGDGTWGFLSLMLFNIWRGGSFTGIFLLAALNGIPQDLFDYAALEVGTGWRWFWMVAVPLLRPFLALAVFLSLGTAVVDLGNVWFQSGQRIVYPIVWTQALEDALLGGQWGEASALSLVLVPVLGVILIACFRLFEPLEEDRT
jgi:ABC-type sugar transport system permease subunit